MLSDDQLEESEEEIINVNQLNISDDEEKRLCKKAKSSDKFWRQFGEMTSLYVMYKNAKSVNDMSESEKYVFEEEEQEEQPDIPEMLQFKANDWKNYVMVLKCIIKDNLKKADRKLGKIDSAPASAIINFLMEIDKGFDIFNHNN